LAISFLFIALGLSELIDFFYRKSVRMRRRRSKLGEILVSEGHITEGDLKEALSEQRLRIGEVLLQAGRITAQQLNQALDYQKKVSKKKLGEILKELGHSTEEDINWALDRMERRLG
jgi:predicted HTH transcriptional regulator